MQWYHFLLIYLIISICLAEGAWRTRKSRSKLHQFSYLIMIVIAIPYAVMYLYLRITKKHRGNGE